MVSTLDVCPWCRAHLAWNMADWQESEVESMTFKCKECGCCFKIQKTVTVPGEESLLVDKKTQIRQIIQSSVS